MELGEELVDSCRETYKNMPTGLGPENIRFIPADEDVRRRIVWRPESAKKRKRAAIPKGEKPTRASGSNGEAVKKTDKKEEDQKQPPPPADSDNEGLTHIQQLETYGFWVSDGRYLLRPETVESYFYGWRITGKKVYKDWAWEAFRNVEREGRGEWGWGEVMDVTKGRRKPKKPSQKGVNTRVEQTQRDVGDDEGEEQDEQEEQEKEVVEEDEVVNEDDEQEDEGQQSESPEWDDDWNSDVEDTSNVSDKCESFWAAETLKYLYLTFADHDVLNLDRWVFNTGKSSTLSPLPIRNLQKKLQRMTDVECDEQRPIRYESNGQKFQKNGRRKAVK